LFKEVPKRKERLKFLCFYPVRLSRLEVGSKLETGFAISCLVEFVVKEGNKDELYKPFDKNNVDFICRIHDV